MYRSVLPYADGYPVTMNAGARSRYSASGYDVDTNRLMRLELDPLSMSWSAAATDDQATQVVTITPLPTPRTFEITLQLFHGVTLLAQSLWTHTQPYRQPRWDTGPLEVIRDPLFDFQTIWILG